MNDKQKHQATNKTLASSMRLFVLLRESLAAQNTGKGNPLFDAVATHANLCGMLIPDKLRMTQAELVALAAQLRDAAVPTGPGVDQESQQAQPNDGGGGSIRRRLRQLTGRLPAGMVALTPDLKIP